MSASATRTAPVAATLAAVALAACSTQETSTPRDTLPPPATVSTTATATSSTTVTPATTAAAGTTAETTSTTTTTTSLPSAPAATSIPIIAGGEGEGWLYLGSWEVDEWREAFDDDGTPVDPDLTGRGADPVFTVSRLGAPPSEARLGPEVVACEQGAFELLGPTVDIEIDAPEPPGFGYAAVALPTADRVLKPRPIAVIRGGAETYRPLGRAAFEDAPVDPASGTVEQTVVTDLDGDGDDEALVVFEDVGPGAGPRMPGDLAALLLVDADTRESSTVTRSFIGPDDGDDTTTEILERFRVLDVLDLNGDGRLEVVVHTWFSEGASVVVFEYDGTDLTEVLAVGCGS